MINILDNISPKQIINATAPFRKKKMVAEGTWPCLLCSVLGHPNGHLVVCLKE